MTDAEWTDPEWVDDFMAFALPDGVDPNSMLDDRGNPSQQLQDIVHQTVVSQYNHVPRSLIIDCDVMVTNEFRHAERFQPAHECAACIAGNDQAKAYMAEHPDKYVVFANLRYQVIW